MSPPNCSSPLSTGRGRSFEDAVAALNSLQSNVEYLKSVKNKPVATQEDKFSFSKQCAEMVGVGPNELSNLSVIHVAGTKGKGSTSAYCESILRHNGYRTGFFSSPHLVSVRERICINGKPLSPHKFSKYFWRIYDPLQEKKDPECGMPAYFAFLTLMAFRVFLEEQVEVAVIEVGIGGEYDTTNILQNTSVVGVTSLGIDHTALLGNTLSSISWQKAGIFKPSAVGYTVSGQSPEALRVLGERSVERKCPLAIAPSLGQYTWPDAESKQTVHSFLPTQQLNVSLALQLTNAWMMRNGRSISDFKVSAPSLCLEEAPPFTVSRKTAEGILKCRWPGRIQILNSDCGHIKYFLDGAHTVESMLSCVEWYMKNRPSSPTVRHALLLNMTGDRDRLQIIEPLFPCKFDKVVFCPNIVHSPAPQAELSNFQLSQNSQLKQSQNLCELWISGRDQQSGNGGRGCSVPETSLKSCVNEALSELGNVDGEWSVLVTGSLHLVGAVLSVLDPNLEKSMS